MLRKTIVCTDFAPLIHPENAEGFFSTPSPQGKAFCVFAQTRRGGTPCTRRYSQRRAGVYSRRFAGKVTLPLKQSLRLAGSPPPFTQGRQGLWHCPQRRAGACSRRLPNQTNLVGACAAQDPSLRSRMRAQVPSNASIRARV